MFLAIINDTYSEVKADFSVIPSREFEISDLIRQVSTEKACYSYKRSQQQNKGYFSYFESNDKLLPA